MKYQLSDKFKIKNIGDEHIVVAKGNTAVDYGAVIVPNESGIFMLGCLENPLTADELADKLTEKYSIEKSLALSDINVFLKKSLDEGIVITMEG